MNDIINNFQFIRPIWLWALVVLGLGYAAKIRFGKDHNVWQQIIPEHLYQQMIVRKGIVTSNKFMHIAALALAFGIIAAAGPSWEKLPQAVYQTQAGKVILIDMSMSMRATDLTPNRLTRARFKAIDLLSEIKEGETGLIAYAGDAFSISPLTDDTTNLTSLIPVLTPEIMPTKGSVAINGLNAAAALLKDAGYQQGQIYWITDGIRYDEIKEVRDFMASATFDVSALLVGTEEGAPITMLDGQLLKDFTGKIVIPSINSRYMNQAMAGTGAEFYIFANDNSDIQAMKRKVDFNQQQTSTQVENTSGDTFKDMGPYLLVLLLPVAAYSFRKGVLSVAYLAVFLLLSVNSQTACALMLQANTPSPAIAQQPNDPAEKMGSTDKPNTSTSVLNQVFKNADQRGKLAFDAQDFQTANTLFQDKSWRAASAYKSGDYANAQTLYEQLISEQALGNIDNIYNYGNSLAKQGKLQEALDAYNQVLNVDEGHSQAAANKKIVEDLLNQQQNQPQDKQQNKQQDGQKQEQKNDESADQNKQDKSDSQEQSNSSQNNQEQGENQDNEQQESQESDSQQQNEQDTSASQQNDEALKQEAQNPKEQEQQADEAQQSPNSQQQNAQQEDKDNLQQSEQEQTAAISNQVNEDDLTPEQKEELKRMQMILNKIPDDPAYLLKRKMQLEAYKRQNNPSPPEQENW